MQGEHRLQEHELAIAVDKILTHLVVAVASRQPLAHDDANLMGEVGVRSVDILVLADEAAQPLGNRTGPRFERGIGQHLVRIDRKGRQRQPDQRDKGEDGSHCAGAADGTARRATPIRRRRSVSDSRPAAAITSAPSQISVT